MKSFFAVLLSLLSILNSCSHDTSKPCAEMLGSYVNDLKSWNWDLRSIGVKYDDSLETLSFSYAIIDEVQMKEARELIVKGAKRLLSAIEQQNINPNFTINDLKLSLSFTKPDHNLLENNLIAYTALYNGKISYCVKHANDPWFHPIHQETYEEALKTVNQERVTLSIQTSTPENTLN